MYLFKITFTEKGEFKSMDKPSKTKELCFPPPSGSERGQPGSGEKW